MRRIWCIVALSLISACADKPPAPEPVAPPAPPPVVAPPVEVTEVAPTPDELPIEQDFEDEAAAQITPDNFRAELDRLEAEIANDSAP